MREILKGKRILIVDDESDILETLEELLDMCLIDKAPDFESGQKFLKKIDYDAAILDIMGVRGFDLLKLATERGIPALILTAHALSPDSLVRSIKEGAYSYVPKDKIAQIPDYLADVIEAAKEGRSKRRDWFVQLKPYFDRRFGSNWKKEHETFWKEYEKGFSVSKNELDEVL